MLIILKAGHIRIGKIGDILEASINPVSKKYQTMNQNGYLEDLEEAWYDIAPVSKEVCDEIFNKKVSAAKSVYDAVFEAELNEKQTMYDLVEKTKDAAEKAAAQKEIDDAAAKKAAAQKVIDDAAIEEARKQKAATDAANKMQEQNAIEAQALLINKAKLENDVEIAKKEVEVNTANLGDAERALEYFNARSEKTSENLPQHELLVKDVEKKQAALTDASKKLATKKAELNIILKKIS